MDTQQNNKRYAVCLQVLATKAPGKMIVGVPWPPLLPPIRRQFKYTVQSSNSCVPVPPAPGHQLPLTGASTRLSAFHEHLPFFDRWIIAFRKKTHLATVVHTHFNLL